MKVDYRMQYYDVTLHPIWQLPLIWRIDMSAYFRAKMIWLWYNLVSWIQK